MADPTLEARRNREREKYLKLSGRRLLLLGGMRYGASNHGKAALKTVLAWKPMFVVDFGCGNNAFIRSLREEGIEGVGIDFANAEADLIAPMHDVPLDAGAADLVTCFDALEHLLPDDVDHVLREMQRVAMPPDADAVDAANRRFIFSISTRKSTIRVGGENLHPTVKPRGWWIERISRLAEVTEVSRRYIQGHWRPLQ